MMLDYRVNVDSRGEVVSIETPLSGKSLLTSPQLNKGTAFSMEERQTFGLLGKLPARIETLEEQVTRAYEQYGAYHGDPIQGNIYLNNLHDKNQVLFYKLVSGHLAEMIPVLYTPTVGAAVQGFSRQFRQPRGMFISYPDRGRIRDILDNRTNPDIEIIVATDGEGVLGIGDQGVGSINIPIAKLMVYTLCGGINPMHTLPVYLDVGTNNPEHLNDPFYLGWRHPRLEREAYDEFLQEFVDAVKEKFPQAFLHWEDFGRDNARRCLDRFRQTVCSFNDDIQGTGAVALAAVLAGVQASGQQLGDQRIVIFGAGTAGTGIADQMCRVMQEQGLSEAQARKQFWLLGRTGLLFDDMNDLMEGQKPYARAREERAHYPQADLLAVIKHVKPTVLVGCSAQRDAFSEAIIREMAKHVEHPMILPLSNPTEKSEAKPSDILEWTAGKAWIATGSPFEPVTYEGRRYPITQCNNALIFPGVGLGVITVGAREVTDEMLSVASRTLSECSPLLENINAALLPSLDNVREVSHRVGVAVAREACRAKLASRPVPEAELFAAVEHRMWKPKYVPLKK